MTRIGARGCEGTEVSFLRHLLEILSPLRDRVKAVSGEQLGHDPSFVAFDGYDTVTVLAEMLRSHGVDRARIADGWPRVAVDGTRGRIQFSRSPRDQRVAMDVATRADRGP